MRRHFYNYKDGLRILFKSHSQPVKCKSIQLIQLVSSKKSVRLLNSLSLLVLGLLLITLLDESKTDTLSLGEGDEGLLAVTDDENV